MAASYDALSDCEGGNVYASLHTGTTAWYILAADRIDPLSGVPISAQPQPGARAIPVSGDYRAEKLLVPGALPPLMLRAAGGRRLADVPCRARYSCVRRTAVAPSPTAEATRLIER